MVYCGMTKLRAVRDPVHGFIELSEVEWNVVNSRPFQRLRDIRQLGMGHMVYPGANHTRFEHSLGCVHVATKFFDTLARNADGKWSDIVKEDNKKRLKDLLRLAALLHDIGHAPFSHAGEDLFVPPNIATSGLKELELKKLHKDYSHEQRTAELIRAEPIAGLIRSSNGLDPEEVVFVATEPHRSKLSNLFSRVDLDLLNSILTGELGADRCDYLLRDAYHSGQPGGSFDLDRLIHQTTLIQHEGVDWIGINEGGVMAAEQMVAARFAAYINLYFHKTKRSYEQHLLRFLKAWLPGGRLPVSPDDFVNLSDSKVLAAMIDAAGDSRALGHDDARAIIARQHFRSVFERVSADFRPSRSGGGSVVVTPESRERFSEKVREEYGQSVFVDVLSHSATKIRVPQHKILVQLGDRVRSLEVLSEIVSGMEDRIQRLRVHASREMAIDVGRACRDRWRLLEAGAEGRR